MKTEVDIMILPNLSIKVYISGVVDVPGYGAVKIPVGMRIFPSRAVFERNLLSDPRGTLMFILNNPV